MGWKAKAALASAVGPGGCEGSGPLGTLGAALGSSACWQQTDRWRWDSLQAAAAVRRGSDELRCEGTKDFLRGVGIRDGRDVLIKPGPQKNGGIERGRGKHQGISRIVSSVKQKAQRVPEAHPNYKVLIPGGVGRAREPIITDETKRGIISLQPAIQ